MNRWVPAFRVLAIAMMSGALLSGCSWFSKEEEKAEETTIIPKFSPEPNDWMAEQAGFTYMLDPSESDVTDFERKEQFAVGQPDPVTHIKVKLVWLEGEGLTDEQRDQFERTGRTIDGTTLHEMVFHFRFDKSSLVPQELSKLSEITTVLDKVRSLPHKILVVGRADSTGSESYNLRLSEQRARSVRDALVAHGANPKAILLRAYGETNPVASNNTEEGRARNRSVTVRWLVNDNVNGGAK